MSCVCIRVCPSVWKCIRPISVLRVCVSVCLSVCMYATCIRADKDIEVLLKASIHGARMCQGWYVFVHLRKCMSIYYKCIYSGLITRPGRIITEHFRLRPPAAVSASCLPIKMRRTITLFLILDISNISPLARALQPSSSRVDARMTLNFRLYESSLFGTVSNQVSINLQGLCNPPLRI